MITERQLQVLRLYAQGYTMDEIAEKLFISKRTVEAHMNGARNKLSASNSVNAVALAVQKGIIKLLVIISVFQAVVDIYPCDMRRPQPVRVRIVRAARPSRTKES